jgi:predicted Zn-dependent protease
MPRFATVCTAAVALFAAAAPASAPAQQARSISASDKAAGAKANPDLLEQYGGAYAGPAADYVSAVGKRIAVQSGLSNSQADFRITLLNSSVNNAFAIPGGYVYVTRQLVALMNDEAELASVLGHEVGHVAARHATKRNTTSTIGQILSAGVSVLTGSQGLGQLAGYGAQMYTLRFSRSQEYQADDLGIRYLASARYDPFAAADMLASLNAQSSLDARLSGAKENATPAWASTHPNTADRVTRARSKAAATPVDRATATRNRDAFLAAIDGMIYDDDPAQGIVDGQTFRHPGLRLQFTAPAGYAIANGTSAVTVSGTGGQAQFGGGSRTSDLAAYVQQAFRSAGAQNGVDAAAIRPARINGMDAMRAVVQANTSQGQVDVGVTAFRTAQGATFHFLTITPAGRGTGPFNGMIESVSPLSAAAAAAIRPRRVKVVTVGARDTIASLSARMAYDNARQERFVVLNALTAGEALRPGQKVKLIVRD